METEIQQIIRRLNHLENDIHLVREIVVSQAETPIDISEAAEFTKISIPGIRLLINKKQIPFHRPTGTRKFRFYKSELSSWMKDKKEATRVNG